MRVTDVINVFTQWIEQHKGLVTAFAVTVAGAATLGIALIAIGIAAKGVAAGLAVVQTAIKGFAFVQGVCIAQAAALKSSFGLMIQAFANYRNMAIPAMVGTEKFCAALGLASTAANRARASIILMSNAEAAAAVKSAITAKWRAMADALTAFRNSAIAATIATKAQAAAEMALGVKTAIINGWLAMTNALKGLTVASISATIALKSQAVAEGMMTAGRAITAGWQAMTTAPCRSYCCNCISYCCHQSTYCCRSILYSRNYRVECCPETGDCNDRRLHCDKFESGSCCNRNSSGKFSVGVSSEDCSRGNDGSVRSNDLYRSSPRNGSVCCSRCRACRVVYLVI